MEENKEPSLEEKLIQIYETLEDKSKCTWWPEKSEWEDVEDEIKNNLIDFKDRWLDDKYLLKEKAFDEITNYYKDLPASIEKIPIGSAGLKGLQIGFYFGNDNTLTDETIKNKFETVCAAKRTVLNSCLNAGTSADVSKKNDFSAWAFLMKLLVCVNYKKAIDKPDNNKYGYFFYYKKAEITKMYKHFVNEGETDFVKQNAAIFSKGCKILSNANITTEPNPEGDLKDALKLSVALVYLLKAPDFNESENNQIGEEKEVVNEYVKLLINNHNIILHGAPGTGKTYLAKEIAKKMIFGDSFDTEKDLTTDEQTQFNEQCGFVQFHQSYDYTDFVEGLRPVNQADNQIGFERKDGVFKAFCEKALTEDKSNIPFIFIIDEINRGEMSKIFGELFFSIDPGYRGKKGNIKTQYANLQEEPNAFDLALGINKNEVEKDGNTVDINKDKYGHFFVPENVYIIGTMNDIDRSVESMDFAMRRRFAFKEITAAQSQESMFGDAEKWEKSTEKNIDGEILNKLKNRMDNLNKEILDEKYHLGQAYQIGGAYFLKFAKYYTGDGNEAEAFNKLWENHIAGVVKEYLRGIDDKKENLFGELKNAYYKELDSASTQPVDARDVNNAVAETGAGGEN